MVPYAYSFSLLMCYLSIEYAITATVTTILDEHTARLHAEQALLELFSSFAVRSPAAVAALQQHISAAPAPSAALCICESALPDTAGFVAAAADAPLAAPLRARCSHPLPDMVHTALQCMRGSGVLAALGGQAGSSSCCAVACDVCEGKVAVSTSSTAAGVVGLGGELQPCPLCCVLMPLKRALRPSS
jgi:hypothetical protein